MKDYTGDNQVIRTCSICGGDLRTRQKFCSGRCRLKAFRLRQAAKIAEDVATQIAVKVREDVYKILVERLVK